MKKSTMKRSIIKKCALKRNTLNRSLIFFAVFTCLTTQKTFSNESTNKFNLNLGDQIILNENSSRISVDRKGIIHVVQVSPQKIQVTGTRSGIAIARIVDRNRNAKYYYFDVHPRSEPPRSSYTPTKENANLPIDIRRKIQYQAEVLLELEETLDMKVKGRDSKDSLLLNINELKPSFNIVADLSNTDETKHRNILGSPSFVALEGEEITIRSGGELRADSHSSKTSDHMEIWHDYGMTISGRFTNIDNDSVQSDLDLILKNPSSNGGQFSVNQIATSARLQLGVKTQIGKVELATDDTRESKENFLTSLPFIGPFFLQSSKAQSNAMLKIFVTVFRK